MSETLTTSPSLNKNIRCYEKHPNLKSAAIGKTYEVTCNPVNLSDSTNLKAKTYILVRSLPVYDNRSSLNIQEVIPPTSPRKWFGRTQMGSNITSHAVKSQRKLNKNSTDCKIETDNTEKQKNSILNALNSGGQGHIVIHCQDVDFGDAGTDRSNKDARHFEELKNAYLNKQRIKEREYVSKIQAQERGCHELVKNGWNQISYPIPENNNDQEKGSINKQKYVHVSDMQRETIAQKKETMDNNVGIFSGMEKKDMPEIKADANTATDEKAEKQAEVLNHYQILDYSTTKSSSYQGPRGQRNTRFGGDRKITAYRPSTTLDTFRKDKYSIPVNIVEDNSVDEIYIEEGLRIWEEVNALINKESDRKTVGDGRAHAGQGFTDSERLRNSIELRALKNVAADTDSVRNYDDKEMDDGLRKEGSQWMSNGTTAVKLEETIETSGNIENNKDIGYNLNSEVNNKGIGHKFDGWRPSIRIVHPVHNKSGLPAIHLPAAGACKGSGLIMTTTLPRITPSSTPLPTGLTQPPRSHSSASMYTAYPPKELSSSMDFIRIPGRVNPLAPPPPRRRINWSWETTDQHYENEKRRLLMQKREHTRYHSAWSKAFYGAPAEKEAYRRHFREVLKQQMDDKDSMRKDEMVTKVKETERALNYDRDCRMNDSQEYYRKHSYLMQYRDVNKQEMEQTWASQRYNKHVEDRVDRERLRYNPINWSCSLK